MDKPKLLTREQVRLLSVGLHPESFEYGLAMTCLHYMDEAERLRAALEEIHTAKKALGDK